MKKHATLFAILLLFAIYSCKKELVADHSAHNSRKLTLAELKKAYGNNGTAANATNGTGQTSGLRIPLWDRAYSLELRDGSNILSVQLSWHSSDARNGSQSRLVAYKDSLNQLHKAIMVVIPDQAYLKENNGRAVLHTFRGKILFFTTANQFMRGYVLEGGKMVGEARLEKVTGTNSHEDTKAVQGWEQECEWVQGQSFVDADGVLNVVSIRYCRYVYVDHYVPPPRESVVPIDQPDPDGGSGYIWTEMEQQNVPVDTALANILGDHCLNPTQLATLNETVNNYLNGNGNAEWACLRKKQYDLMKNLGIKFSFCVKPITGTSQAYSPTLDEFIFTDDFALTMDNTFDHEFFHAYQNKFLPSGTAMYAAITNTATNTTTYPDGFINIEFETALYLDITRSRFDQSAFVSTSIPGNIRDEYIAWLNAITEMNTKYPKNYTDFGGQYFYFMEKFKQYSGYSDKGNIKYTLMPLTLNNLFNTTNCK